MRPSRDALKVLGFNVLLLGLLLGLVEGGASLFVPAAGRFLPKGRLLDLARSIYWRNVTQIGFSQECGAYDERLAYTLRPGVCTFTSAAFATTLSINRLGLRDDERSLDHPRVIVLGDSHAMGWGVDQDRTFPEILEQRLGFPVLNAAVPSYGTAREVISLARLQTDRLRLLIIQYCDNDFEENEAFEKNDNTLPIMSRARYDELAALDRRDKRYFFGKSTLQLVHHAVRDLAWHPAPGSKTRVAPEQFLNALVHAPIDLHGVPILVFEINTGYEGNDAFIPLLDGLLAAEPERAGGLRIATLDLRGILQPDDYFRLDGHLDARGHERVAGEILRRLPALLPQ